MSMPQTKHEADPHPPTYCEPNARRLDTVSNGTEQLVSDMQGDKSNVIALDCSAEAAQRDARRCSINSSTGP